MTDYRVKIRLLSPLGTPWQSDTVFGHLAWHVARKYGERAVQEFLEPFRQGSPPFVLSDGFPGDLLPRPLLPVPLSQARSPADYAAMRARRKSLFVSLEDFSALRSGAGGDWQPAPDPWVPWQIPHAAISRHTDTTTGLRDDEGGNFFLTDMEVLAQGDLLSLYLRADDEWADRVPQMLAELAPLGFGRDRSVGAGAFEVVEMQPYNGFGDLPGANGFVSLSSYCPAQHDPTRGRWRVRLKYGKLGEHAGGGYPFKRPLIQLEPGAVFLTNGPPRPYYGRAVAGVAPGFPEAIQCCYTLAVPAVLPPNLDQ